MENNQVEDLNKYVQHLEMLLVILMSKVDNDIIVMDEELQVLNVDSVLDVQTIEGGIRLRMIVESEDNEESEATQE